MFNFWTTLIQKRYFRSKKEKKRKITIKFYIFKLVRLLNFSFNKKFDFLDQNFLKNKKKNE